MPKKDKLPKEIIVFGNKDKLKNESWAEYRMNNPANFPHPFQMLLLAPQNSGKTNTIKNVIIQQKPDFDRVLLWLNEGTNEYDDLLKSGAELFTEPPQLEDLDRTQKQVLIIDDINFNKFDPNFVTTLIRHWSTHYSLSIIVSIHDLKNIQACNRRLFNVYLIYKSPDMISTAQLAQKVGLHSKDLKYIMYKSGLIKNRFTHVTIDNTSDTPFPLRIGLFEPLEIIEHEDKTKEYVKFANAKDYLGWKNSEKE